MSPWKVILATMVIFGCGVVTGALVMRTEVRTHPFQRPDGMHAGPHPGAGFPGPFQNEGLLRLMDTNLTLTPEQHEKIGKIMHASQEVTRDFREKELARVREAIRQELTPAQCAKFAEQLKMGEPRPEGPRPWDGDGRRRGDGFFSNRPPDRAATNPPASTH